MNLWNIIRDWFVEYVFGGTNYNGEIFSGQLGRFGYLNGEDYKYDIVSNNSDIYVPLGANFFDAGSETTLNLISFGDWLSSTATLIVLIALCLFLFLAVKWVFNVFRNTLERVGK